MSLTRRLLVLFAGIVFISGLCILGAASIFWAFFFGNPFKEPSSGYEEYP